MWVLKKGPGPEDQYTGKNRFIEKLGVQDEVGRHVIKRSSDPHGSPPRSLSSGTGPNASCGYCCPLCPAGVQYSGNIRFYRAPKGRWAQETYAGCPQQRYTTGESGKVQGRDRVGIVDGSCGNRARRVSIGGKFVLSRNPGYKTRVVSM